ncbi:tetratricopeptide repeat protein [Streptomyces sp. NPDC102364]|uniref:tetratricopeptide repeat protein n=1 Tax=Streptomyces sp. NPDC102364 TaxID=3366161 RepID=UPI00382EEAC5
MGRQEELAVFKEALRMPPGEVAQFIFHIHGPAGVGKSTLVRHLESAAQEAGAATALVDESAADIVEVMSAISVQFAKAGRPLKAFEKLLATYRQRRHEAHASIAGLNTSAGLESDPAVERSPSASSLVASQVGLAGLSLIPGVGPFAGAVDANQVAIGADRLKAVLSSRIRSHEDVELLMSPAHTLAPVFLEDLSQTAERLPWVTLFLDTYERSGPILDVWLRSLLIDGRYGELPANILVVIAGQGELDVQCWADWRDFIHDIPLDAFTEAEGRLLLASKGVTDEKIIQVMLQSTGRLPVLLSTLAETRPSRVDEISDPSETAVERFLKWENDPAKRSAALSAAFPQAFDEDIFRIAVDDEDQASYFDWLRSMPFVSSRSGRCRYHGLVRTSMLRMQRQKSLARWGEIHGRLEDNFRRARVELEEDLPTRPERWQEAEWREFRLQETYHQLCVDPRSALAPALREALDAYSYDPVEFRRWAQCLVQAGEDSGAQPVGDWGRRLLESLASSDPGLPLTIIASEGELDATARSLAFSLRGREHRKNRHFELALTDYETAHALDPSLDRPLAGRGATLRNMGRNEEALADLTRAIEISPAYKWAIAERILVLLNLRRHEDSLADLAYLIESRADDRWAISVRSLAYRAIGRLDDALADISTAISLSPGNLGYLVRRSGIYRDMGRMDKVIEDLDRAIQIDPDSSLALVSRGSAYRELGRFEEAISDLTRCLEHDPGNEWALAVRGDARMASGFLEEAIEDLDLAIQIDSRYQWAFLIRARTLMTLRRFDESISDIECAIEISPDGWGPHARLADSLRHLGRFEDAIVAFSRAMAAGAPAWVSVSKATVYRIMGRLQESLAVYESLDQSEIDDPRFRAGRGATLRYLGRFVEAQDDLALAWERNPSGVWINYERAVALRALGDQNYRRFALRVIDLARSEGNRDGKVDIYARGNLVLVHCLLESWGEAERELDGFLGGDAAEGEKAELLAAASSLAAAFPSMGDQISQIRARMQGE